MGPVEGRVCIGLAIGAATALEVGEVDPRRVEVSLVTGAALSPDRMVSTNCLDGTGVLVFENCKDITLD
jgi:hypothetical protein